MLPASFGDFVAVDHPRYPHFTLMTREDAERCGPEESDGSNGWVDRILDVAEIDEATARSAIAAVLGVEPGEIEVIVEG